MTAPGPATLVPESGAMRLLRRMGLDRPAWSLRRLHCPVPADALVLEVGSGGNPYARANVLLDAYEHTRERHWVPLVADRPTVLGFVERLPFRDGAFDFVIASHVLEHSRDPARFLGELARVARAGYIEVPDAFMERINPYRDHRLEITQRDGRLLIRRKRHWRHDAELVDLYERRAKRWIAGETIPRHPFDFHVRHYWQGRIDFEVLDEDQPFAEETTGSTPSTHAAATSDSLRARLLRGTRTLLSQARRNRSIDLAALLRCPSCGGEHLQGRRDALECGHCAASYPVRNGIPVMYASLPDESRGGAGNTP